jgi:gas vesicle protein|tara:strand:- start:315 stop:566 length:252 start_codon:yes stop_codon:yes gene_type:complete
MEILLSVVAGALVGAAATYLFTKKKSNEMKESLYDVQLVNRFLKEYLQRSKNRNNGKKRYYKNKRTQKAGAAGNKSNQSSKQQ